MEDLPLQLWNMRTFELIGSKCGGLIQVDRTINREQLFTAKMNVRRKESGFIPAEIDVIANNRNFIVKTKKCIKSESASKNRSRNTVDVSSELPRRSTKRKNR